MAKFSSNRFPPGFFDLPQRAGETLPLDLIGEWTRGEQSAERAHVLLAPHTIRGTLVVTDAAGLTRLSRERPLIDILASLAQAKELFYAYGRAIGGRSIGVWAADNTQMFYDASIPARRVVAMMRAVMQRVAVDCEVGMGMAAHSGAYVELGQAVYGTDADLVETLGEEHTSGGEMIITGALRSALDDADDVRVELRADLGAKFGPAYRVTAAPTLEGLDLSDTAYPAPFSSGFSEGLSRYSRTRRESMVPRQPYQELAVVLIMREREVPDIPEVAVLNNLSLTAATKRIGATLLAGNGEEIKCTDLLSIYTFVDCGHAIAFARAFREALAEQGIQCRIGVDVGPVLVFDLAEGSREIAGSPVNIASKLAEDVGEYGKIQMTEAVAVRAGARRERPTLQFTVSGIDLRAYDV
jgi:class 3 adenylate cyclase